MIPSTTQKSYYTDYELLQLDDTADWSSARTNYKRLVHLWHPDKFAQRPRERAHAQQQFINLTKSYNSLRNFQRKNGRLPFESVNARGQERVSGNRERKRDIKSIWTKNQSAETDFFSPGMLGRDNTSQRAARAGDRFTRLYIAAGALVIISTIAFMIIQDSKATKATLEEGRKVVKQAPQSEFLPNFEKIRETRSREAVLKPPR